MELSSRGVAGLWAVGLACALAWDAAGAAPPVATAAAAASAVPPGGCPASAPAPSGRRGSKMRHVPDERDPCAGSAGTRRGELGSGPAAIRAVAHGGEASAPAR